MSEIAWVQIGTLVTLVSGFLFQWAREARNRRWDLQDRSQARKEIDRKHDENKQGLAQNTRLTIAAGKAAGEAYMAANDMNNKIFDLNARLNELGTMFDPEVPTAMSNKVDQVAEKMDHMLAVIEEVKTGVRDAS